MGKEKDEISAINFLQSELHEICYSYFNGGFSKFGYAMYPLVNGVSNEIKQKIFGLKRVAEFLSKKGYDFSKSLSLYADKRINADNLPIFLSALYYDLGNTKKNKVPSKRIKLTAIDIDNYSKKNFLYPVIEMRNFAEKNLRKFMLDMHLHGSLATLDYKEGWSDFDTLIIIKKDIFQIPENMIKLRNLLYESKKYFFKVDPLQHHGHMVLTEYDIDYYCETFFPLVLFRYSKSFFGQKFFVSKVRDCKVENRKRFDWFVEYFIKLGSERRFNANSYNLKFFFHLVSLFPIIYLQSKGVHVYKKFSFDKAKKDFSDKEWEPIEMVTKIRNNWKIPKIAPFTCFISGINPLLAYRANSIYWNFFYDIKKMNNVDIVKLVKGMTSLAKTAKEIVKVDDGVHVK